MNIWIDISGESCYIYTMIPSDFLNNILLRYIAFLDRKSWLETEMTRFKRPTESIHTVFTFKADTGLPKCMVYDHSKHLLVDYSAVCNADVTKDNATDLMKNMDIKKIPVSSLSRAQCEEIMYNNLLAQERYPKIIKECKHFAEIQEAMQGWIV